MSKPLAYVAIPWFSMTGRAWMCSVQREHRKHTVTNTACYLMALYQDRTTQYFCQHVGLCNQFLP